LQQEVTKLKHSKDNDTSTGRRQIVDAGERSDELKGASGMQEELRFFRKELDEALARETALHFEKAELKREYEALHGGVLPAAEAEMRKAASEAEQRIAVLQESAAMATLDCQSAIEQRNILEVEVQEARDEAARLGQQYKAAREEVTSLCRTYEATELLLRSELAEVLHEGQPSEELEVAVLETVAEATAAVWHAERKVKAMYEEINSTQREALHEEINSQHRSSQGAALFDLFDTNKDGVVDREEWVRTLQGSHEKELKEALKRTEAALLEKVESETSWKQRARHAEAKLRVVEQGQEEGGVTFNSQGQARRETELRTELQNVSAEMEQLREALGRAERDSQVAAENAAETIDEAEAENRCLRIQLLELEGQSTQSVSLRPVDGTEYEENASLRRLIVEMEEAAVAKEREHSSTVEALEGLQRRMAQGSNAEAEVSILKEALVAEREEMERLIAQERAVVQEAEATARLQAEEEGERIAAALGEAERVVLMEKARADAAEETLRRVESDTRQALARTDEAAAAKQLELQQIVDRETQRAQHEHQRAELAMLEISLVRDELDAQRARWGDCRAQYDRQGDAHQEAAWLEADAALQALETALNTSPVRARRIYESR